MKTIIPLLFFVCVVFAFPDGYYRIRNSGSYVVASGDALFVSIIRIFLESGLPKMEDTRSII